ncbi:SDR family oxidoreductase [Nitrospira sp. BLG_1]|uniref:SDR family oxidoreductase n=1 Tax=Nitrospira sp. BLG_1 TaxID=3395883 RepID=UPI0039BCBA12
MNTSDTMSSSQLTANSVATPRASLILLTGASGYIGGRLLPALEQQGYRLRCLARHPEILKPKVGASTEVIAGDVLDRASLDIALHGVDVAYYMVHSMRSTGSFEDTDRMAAKNFSEAAKVAGVKALIYVGGLGRDDEQLSVHLRSRHEVGDILRQSGLPVCEFRASAVIGSGSASFELIRGLVERLPVMLTPKWIEEKAQPIAIDDLLDYLVEALRIPTSRYQTYEVGGADQLSYADMMRAYGRQRGLRPLIIPVPVLTPWLSALWLGLVTPLYARIGRAIIESIVHVTVVRGHAARTTFSVRPIGVDEAIRRAIAHEEKHFSATRWSDAISSSGRPPSWGGVRFGTRIVDSRTMTVQAPAPVVFRCIERLGGDHGWYAWNWLWRLRGFIDLLQGGVGMRRGRPLSTNLRVGDTVDSFRVEAIEPSRRLRLKSEMNLPGRAWLEFEVTEISSVTQIRQTAIFDPVGLKGQLYWYSLYVPHEFVFNGMLRGIAQASLHEVGILDHRHLQSRIGRSQGCPSDTPSANDAGSSGTLNRISINPICKKTSIVTTKLMLLLGIPLMALLAVSSLQAGPIDVPGHPQQKAVQLVHEAEHEVDHAWEVYHRAALEGTVASPKLQSKIEEHLHQARTLITQAHEAADHGDQRQVEALIKQVHIHTAHAIEGSKESKQ